MTIKKITDELMNEIETIVKEYGVYIVLVSIVIYLLRKIIKKG